MRHLKPIHDPVVGEDVSWRLWYLDQQYMCFDGEPLPSFVRRQYEAPSETWDHDHCVMCITKFMQDGAYDTLASGWAAIPEGIDDTPESLTTFPDGSVMLAPPGNATDWLCDECHGVLTRYLKGEYVLEWQDHST